jgi:hypothetical protein
MQYKVLPAPDNLPVLHEPNSYVISGRFAEDFKH